MRSLIVGTAGHVDHGKSALVRALTGTDPDRLKEEQERGITIDLGFAHLTLEDGSVVSFVDVPGHERFVHNMLAGAHGIDAVLLVVAADESVMPQTREHFQICRLLGIERGLIALTKCDLADAETQALAEIETRELVAGSFLAGAPSVRVSAQTGSGIDELKQALQALARHGRERASGGLFRLPIDRVFTLRGFGTVVTGTLVSGELAEGEEVQVLPGGKRSRVRGLQIHGQGVTRAAAGHRTAVNLADLSVTDLRRGDVLVRPGTLQSTSIVDVELELLRAAPALKGHARVRVHAASAEALARVEPLAGDEVAPGATAFAQLRLEAPVAVGRSDRLVLRSYSPAATIGGARVLDPLARKWRRRGSYLARRLADLARAAPLEAAVLFLEDAGGGGGELATLASRVTLPAVELAAALSGRADVIALGRDRYLTRAAHETLAGETLALLEQYHRDHPLQAVVSREHLRQRVFAHAPEGAFEHVLAELAGQERVVATSEAVALVGHSVSFSPEEARVREALLNAAQAAGLAGFDAERLDVAGGADARLVERVLRTLVAEGRVVQIVPGVLLHAERLAALKGEVRERWPPGTRFDVGAFKDLTGQSRRMAIPLLEYLDAQKVTRRLGNERVVLDPGPALVPHATAAIRSR